MHDNILDMVRKKASDAARDARRALIIQPGAIGDCILTLPLAEFLKTSVGIGAVDILGHTEYIAILPGKTCVDRIRSIDAVDLHRLFTDSAQFQIEDADPLVLFFAEYEWLITFLGEPGDHFEQNLIFTANCSRSAAVITIPLKPPKDFAGHITDFYIQQFVAESDLDIDVPETQKNRRLIASEKSDSSTAEEILAQVQIPPTEKLIIIHPGSGGKHKCWPLTNYLALAEQLRKEDYEIAFLLGPAELERLNKSDLARITNSAPTLTDLSLNQLCALFTRANAFIGNDSGITHLAAATGLKTVAIFLTTAPRLYRPFGPDVRVFVASEPDSPTKTQADILALFAD